MNGFHQPFAEAMRAIIFVDEDIAEIGEDRVIADDARETNLLFFII